MLRPSAKPKAKLPSAAVRGRCFVNSTRRETMLRFRCSSRPRATPTRSVLRSHGRAATSVMFKARTVHIRMGYAFDHRQLQSIRVTTRATGRSFGSWTNFASCRHTNVLPLAPSSVTGRASSTRRTSFQRGHSLSSARPNQLLERTVKSWLRQLSLAAQRQR